VSSALTVDHALVRELKVGDLAEVGERGAFFGPFGIGAGQFFAHRVGLAFAQLEEAVAAEAGGNDPLTGRGLPFGVGHRGAGKRRHRQGHGQNRERHTRSG